MAMEMRSEREHYSEQSGSGSSTARWSSKPLVSRYSVVRSPTGVGADFSPAAVVPGAISRNIMGRSGEQNSSSSKYEIATSSGHHQPGRREAWLKPVSTLLRGIPYARSGLEQQQQGFPGVSEATERYPAAPTAVHMAPTPPIPARSNASHFSGVVQRRDISAPQPLSIHSSNGNRNGSLGGRSPVASSPRRGGGFSYGERPRTIEVPLAPFPYRADLGHLRSVSPHTVRREDVFHLPPANDRLDREADHYLPSPTKRHHGANTRFPHGASPAASDAAAAATAAGLPTMAPPFEYSNTFSVGAGGGPGSSRANDNFNCCQVAKKHHKFKSFDSAAGAAAGAAAVAGVGSGAAMIHHRELEAEGVGYYFDRPAAPGAAGGPPARHDAGDAAGRFIELDTKASKRPAAALARRGENVKKTGVTTEGVRRNRCLRPGCVKPPRYALPGQKAEYCSQHKMENYVDVKHPRCESELGCVRQPTFGWEGEKARFCSAHKVEGMLDVKNPRCAEPGCMKRPRYGDEGERARFCAAHKYDDMVDLASRRGSKCTSPAKRSRDGPRSFAHDSAAAASSTVSTTIPSGSRRSMPSFNLGSAGSAPAPTRGHTPAHAGGHRRATSESWIDFCPKRLYDTTIKNGNDGSAQLSGNGRFAHPARTTYSVPEETSSRNGSFHGSSSGGGSSGSRDGSGSHGGSGSRGGIAGIVGCGKGVPVGSVRLVTVDREKSGVVPAARVSLSPASPPSRPAHLPPKFSSPSPSSVSGSGVASVARRQQQQQPQQQRQPRQSQQSQPSTPKNHRFDAVDYEASAILLECRSGALLPTQD